MRDAQQTADYLIDEFNDNALYDIATSILYYLEGKYFCIWQTYTKENIKENTGKKPTKDDMAVYQERLANIWEQIC